MNFHLFKGTFLIRESATGNKTKNETTILNEPTISLEKTSKPLFIKIKEVPQISMSMMRMPQAIVFRFKVDLLLNVNFLRKCSKVAKSINYR
jgi:hypothetical protein